MDKHGLSGFEDVTLVRRTDDFSEQFSIPDDKRFWIRIEVPLGTRVVVSDLLFGGCDAYQMAAALGQAFSQIGVRRPSEIVFKNVGLVDDVSTAETVDRIHRVAEALVLRQRRFIVARNFEIKHNKVDVVVSLKNFD